MMVYRTPSISTKGHYWRSSDFRSFGCFSLDLQDLRAVIRRLPGGRVALFAGGVKLGATPVVQLGCGGRC